MSLKRKNVCVVDGCIVRDWKSERSFHLFPSNEDTKKIWIETLGLKEYPTPNARVCSMHFASTDFSACTNTRKRLFPGALPIGGNLCFSPSTCQVKNSLKPSCAVPQIVNPEYGDTSYKEAPKNFKRFKYRLNNPDMTSVYFKRKLKIMRRKISRLSKNLEKCKAKLKDRSDKTRDLDHCNQIQKITDDASRGDHTASYLHDQIINYGKKKLTWSETTIRYCIVWRLSSTKGYEHARSTKLILAPSRPTLEKYMGNTEYGVGMSALAKERLVAECSALPTTPLARFASLIIDEMAVREKLEYDNSCDKFFGLVENGDDEAVGKYPKLANKLLCFVLHGLSSQYTIPAAYYWTRSVSAQSLYEMTLKTISGIEDCGFFIIRIVTDNHRSNVGLFKQLGEGELKTHIPHPFRPQTELFLSFDYCHVIKNVRSQFLSNDMADDDGIISASYVKELYSMQRNLVIKPVRFLTAKHIDPSNFEKMNVASAVQLFSIPVTATIKYVKLHQERCKTTLDFSKAGSTIRFMELMRKFFAVHDTSDRVQYRKESNADKRHYSALDDARLNWLSVELPDYMNEIRLASRRAGLRGFTKETREAMLFTCKSTCECIAYLLESGFYYVLTRNFSSDPVEATFSAIRTLGGSNDATDVRAATFAIRRILRSGLITASNCANVAKPGQSNYLSLVSCRNPPNSEGIEDFDSEDRIDVDDDGENFNSEQCIEVCSNLEDDENPLRVESLRILQEIRNPEWSAPFTTLESASQALVGGFVVKAVLEKLTCQCCISKIALTETSSPLLDLIHVQDMGGYHYPTSAFVLQLKHVQMYIELVVQQLHASASPFEEIRAELLPALSNSRPFQCIVSPQNTKIMAEVIINKFVRPVLRNIGKKITENTFKKKVINKPLSRKVLKL